MLNSVPSPRRPEPAASRYSRVVDLADLNNAQSLGVLLVPPGARVLDIGAADGSVSAALKARECVVTAVEVDPAAAVAAKPRCHRILCADVERLNLSAALGDERFDVVLLLDVLEHLREPVEFLRRLPALLAPSGQVVASIPNVAHAAVRLALFQGRFTRTEFGLLDRTHLHFFDRLGVEALFADAGLHVLDTLTVTRTATETEIAVDLSTLPVEIVRAATADPESETYQFIVVARPRADARSLACGTLAGRLQASLRTLERDRRKTEAYVRSLDRSLIDRQKEIVERERTLVDAQQTAADLAAARDRLATELDRVVSAKSALELDYRKLEGYAESLKIERERTLVDAQQTAADLAAARDRRATELDRVVSAKSALELAYRKLESYAASLDETVGTTGRALSDAQMKAAHLRRDVALKDAYLSALRERIAEFEEVQAAAQRVEPPPRYVIVDRVNAAIKRLPFIHRWLRAASVRALGAQRRA